MKVKEISYLERVDDVEKGHLDVYVTLENDENYIVEVTTPKFLSYLMEETQGNFLPPDCPYIYVSKLTPEIIKAAIQEYVDAQEDCYWLKLYHVSATLNIEELNEILAKKDEEEKEDRLILKALEDEEE